MTNIEFTDTELSILADIVKQHKITISNDDLTSLVTGRRSTPYIDLTLKVTQALITRQQELNTATHEISN